MTKPTKSTLILCLLTALVVGLAAPAPAQEKAAPKAETKEKGEGKKRDTYPFTGKITSVDKVNKSIMLNGKEGDRVINVSSATKLFKAGKPATLEEAVVGEDATGQAHKVDGKVEALSVYLGPKPEGKGGKKKKDEKKDEKKTETK